MCRPVAAPVRTTENPTQIGKMANSEEISGIKNNHMKMRKNK